MKELNSKSKYSIVILTTQICILSYLLSGCASLQPTPSNSQENEVIGNQQEKQQETTVPEGRGPVEFYPMPQMGGNDPWRLSDIPIPYPIYKTERLEPLLEIGNPFLGNGPIQPGIETPSGQILQPSFLLYGTFRSALQSFDDGDSNTVEWANRLDLHGNLNLSGTERILFSMRPLDRRNGEFTGYNFHSKTDEGWQNEFNLKLTGLFFEGELGEIFPNLDPTDSSTLDWGFSIGRQPLLVQDGLLLNDTIDSFGITRNSLILDGITNLRLTGIVGWNDIHQGFMPSDNHSSMLYGLLSEADTAWGNTLLLDLLYVEGKEDEDAWFIGASSIQRIGWLNTSFRINASIPSHRSNTLVGEGIIFVSELSSTLSGSDNIVYANIFWTIDEFTSAARDPSEGTPVANLGILYSPVGMGKYQEPLGQPIADTVGTAIGFQMFFDGIRSQLITEFGARKSTKSRVDRNIFGFGIRYQIAIGARHLVRIDSFAASVEGNDNSHGVRLEWLTKF